MTALRPLRAALTPAALLLALAPAPALAQVEVRTELVGHQFFKPILVLSAPGDTRLYVVEQTGKVKIVEDGEVRAIPFLDISNKLSPGGERGLLGMAFNPQYEANGYCYINYTDLNGDTVVERYTRSATDPNVVDPSTLRLVLGPVSQPSDIHNGGCMVFGPDGKLYIGMGDGGHSSDMGPGHAPEGNGQSLFTLHGKLLRLDVDAPYRHVPEDNPFVGTAEGLDLIWALGLREPWRFSFDRKTGDLYIGDVGGGTREEIDYVPYTTFSDPDTPVMNFGWRCQEGTWCTGLSGCRCGSQELIDPIAEFDHSVGCAVIGGHVYRGCRIPAFDGYYVYAAFCYTGPARIFAFRIEDGVKGPTIELTDALKPDDRPNVGRVTTFGEDLGGEIYFSNLEGSVYRIAPAQTEDCNGNGVEDACDLASGVSLDLNRNGVPDECEGLSGPASDKAPNYPSTNRPKRRY